MNLILSNAGIKSYNEIQEGWLLIYIIAKVKKYGRTQKAITETIRICKDRDILRDYLAKREQEVVTIMKSLFSQEDAVKEYGDEREIEGAVDLAKEMKMTDQQIEDYLMKKFNLTRDEAKKYLAPAYV